MHLDLATILILHPLSLTVGALCFLYLRYRSRRNRGLGKMAVAFLILALGSLIAGAGEQEMVHPADIVRRIVQAAGDAAAQHGRIGEILGTRDQAVTLMNGCHHATIKLGRKGTLCRHSDKAPVSVICSTLEANP